MSRHRSGGSVLGPVNSSLYEWGDEVEGYPTSFVLDVDMANPGQSARCRELKGWHKALRRRWRRDDRLPGALSPAGGTLGWIAEGTKLLGLI